MNVNFTNKDITHIKNGELEYLQFNILNKYQYKLKHCCTLKNGGVSEGVHSSLNFKLNTGDKKENIYKNLDIICSELKIDPSNIYMAKQTHTDKVLILDLDNMSEYEYKKENQSEIDGYITDKKNIATLVTTADCNPIIIYDPIKNVVSNIHSGWRGTVKQIYLNAVKAMNKRFNSKYSDMIVCIGPSINKCCWNSSDSRLKEEFLKLWPYEDEYIISKSNGEYFVDFPYVIKKELMNIGVQDENIILSNICTVCNEEKFFSYRRTRKSGIEQYGTMATIVELI
ncbi:MAG: peptidoglycan editing factor PgeF [Clostridia bacterium]|nr:peptidoglycan editing factor PgeF [Clostridia bacterium]